MVKLGKPKITFDQAVMESEDYITKQNVSSWQNPKLILIKNYIFKEKQISHPALPENKNAAVNDNIPDTNMSLNNVKEEEELQIKDEPLDVPDTAKTE